MKVSIAMATYNGARYIGEQIESFISQTHLPDELVITDDGSTDNTLGIVSEFKSKVPFEIRVAKNSNNLGYAGNFNKALSLTSGDLVFLSDQDDVWFSNKIETICSLAESMEHMMLFMNDAALTDEILNEVGLTKIEQMDSAGIERSHFVMGCCCAIRRPFLDLVLPIPDGFSAHDKWLVKIANGLNLRVIIDVVLQYYRRHGDNESLFIANSLKRVNSAQAFYEKLKESKDDTLQNDLVEVRHLMDCLERLTVLQPAWAEDANSFKRSLLDFHKNTKKRIAVRNKSFVRRIFEALMLGLDGGYADRTGIKSMIRDIIRL